MEQNDDCRLSISSKTRGIHTSVVAVDALGYLAMTALFFRKEKLIHLLSWIFYASPAARHAKRCPYGLPWSTKIPSAGTWPALSKLISTDLTQRIKIEKGKGDQPKKIHQNSFPLLLVLVRTTNEKHGKIEDTSLERNI